MSQISAEDESEFQSVEATAKKHQRQNLSYEFVKYLRQYVESSLGAVMEEETERCTRGEGHAVGSGQDVLVHAVTRRTRESVEYKKMMQTPKNTMMVVVEPLINTFEEDQLRKEEMQGRANIVSQTAITQRCGVQVHWEAMQGLSCA
uniref:BROMI N-terminal domain-containing protein n=2 Tax=Hucho hucho TaxID=62062 RepID=A0A4W5R7C8_9TELE